MSGVSSSVAPRRVAVAAWRVRFASLAVLDGRLWEARSELLSPSTVTLCIQGCILRESSSYSPANSPPPWVPRQLLLPSGYCRQRAPLLRASRCLLRRCPRARLRSRLRRRRRHGCRSGLRRRRRHGRARRGCRQAAPLAWRRRSWAAAPLGRGDLDGDRDRRLHWSGSSQEWARPVLRAPGQSAGGLPPPPPPPRGPEGRRGRRSAKSVYKKAGVQRRAPRDGRGGKREREREKNTEGYTAI